jgi:ribonuclease HI
MKEKDYEKFKKTRIALNDIVMKYSKRNIKRFYSLDSQVYQDGSLSKKTKELLGLTASLVLRCDDCITYHIIQCFEAKVTSEELEEALAIGLIVGGSIIIPHLRRALQTWDTLTLDSRPSTPDAFK